MASRLPIAGLLLPPLLAGCGALSPTATQAPAPAPAAATASKAAPVEAAPPKAATQAATKPAAATKAATPPPKVTTTAAATAVTAPLDLRSLEERLKDTGAIGVLTKLSLKNQVDDLVSRFRAFHAGQRPPTLAELKPQFDLLLMKVLSLLQDHDTKLANDINASRDAIWGVLTDRNKLAQFT